MSLWKSISSIGLFGPESGANRRLAVPPSPLWVAKVCPLGWSLWWFLLSMPPYEGIVRKEVGYKNREALPLLLDPSPFPTVGSLSRLADVAETQFLSSFRCLWRLYGNSHGQEIIVPIKERGVPSVCQTDQHENHLSLSRLHEPYLYLAICISPVQMTTERRSYSCTQGCAMKAGGYTRLYSIPFVTNSAVGLALYPESLPISSFFGFHLSSRMPFTMSFSPCPFYH